MYGVSNVEGINLFILGYTCGCRGNDCEIINSFSLEFRSFVNAEHADDFVAQTDFDWPRLVRLYSGGDMHSIELFGRWFDAFVTLFKAKYKLN